MASPVSAVAKLKSRAARAETSDSREVELPLSAIRFDEDQPRKGLSEESIIEMAQSLEQQGQIHAITVQDNGDGTYLLVAGERRTRGQTHRHAHMGGPGTIRATVRSDMTDRRKRKLFQLAENIHREDLSEVDAAAGVIDLMRDIPGQQEGLSQREIAAALGKSEGWVSRHVKFADTALQEKWVKPGILDTVEKVYRMTTLPKSTQDEILRRVSLPGDHEEHLAKPVARSVIDGYAQQAKIGRMAQNLQASIEPSKAAPAYDPVAAELARAVKDQYQGPPAATLPPPKAGVTAANIKSLAAESNAIREEHRRLALADMEQSQPPDKPKTSRDATLPDVVRCKLEVTSVPALLAMIQPNRTLRKSLKEIKCNLSLPGELAQLLVNAMTKKKIAAQEIANVLQREFGKLK